VGRWENGRSDLSQENDLSGTRQKGWGLAEREVSMKELKEDARRVLPSNSLLLKMLEDEPDSLPRSVARIKVETYAKMLYKERGRA
jgi:hypothetical protein